MKVWSIPLVTALLAIGLVASAWAGEPDEEKKRSVDTPAEAARKAAPASKETGVTTFGGGVWKVDQPGDDLAEPLPAASEGDFKKQGYDVHAKDAGDPIVTVVDPAGQIYRDRRYRGIIPGIRNTFNKRRWERLTRYEYVTWVGFQPKAAVSVVFFQLTAPAAVYEVNKLDQKTIEVFFPGGKIRKYNNRRTLYTEHFKGPVVAIRGKRVKGGVRYTIHLRQPARHLPRFEAPFLFLEFEH